jgi:hypothetical protein
MAWDPSVLRKYSTTSHFRLLNQVRSELKNNPLSRHEDGGINVGLGRRSTPSRVVMDGRGPFASSRPARGGETRDSGGPESGLNDGRSFRERLRAIEMR